jgi:HEAT repeat protein
LALDLLLDSDRRVRQRVRKSLELRPNMRQHPDWRDAWERIGRSMADEDWNRRVATTEILAELGEPAIPHLIQCWLDPHSVVRSAADQALRSIDKEWATRPSAREAVPALLAALTDPARGGLRRYVAGALGKIGDRRAIGALVVSLCDEHGDGWTLNALDAIDREWPRDPGALAAAPLLLEAAAGKGSSPPSPFAIEALSRVSGAESIGLSLRLLNDPSPSVVAAAAAALGRTRASEALEPLLSLLAHEHYFVRREAAMALGDIGSRRAVPALEAIRKDRDFAVREAVDEALRRCKAEGAPPE